uniref:Protein phosphatase inhibitor 2 n=1 Tax=Acrobeloides nanus TaxID=290746 RepID=A0A914BVX7_9BILA
MASESIPMSASNSHLDPTECLKMKPKKSILKAKQTSFEEPPQQQERRESEDVQKAHFDELNILATHHPADKDYGHMKIDEPKTPYHGGISDGEDDGASTSSTAHRPRRVSLVGMAVDPEELRTNLEAGVSTEPKMFTYEPGSGPESSEEELELSAEERARRLEFKKKRRAHYNEGNALKQMKALAAEELKNIDDDDD